ncbi:GrpB family protein [Bacillus sp. BGMRC 2118]|nr:GrpB family protein [Bacillus sp. BGMRC 2118]
MRKIEVVPYQKKWKSLYAFEEKLISSILGEQVVHIHHIGSTAIPNMMAKPVIDILVEVKDIDKVDEFNCKFIEVGYEPKGENGILHRRYFQKGGDVRTHHVHIFKANHPEVTRHVAFRDYLIEHPAEAKEYEELKKNLALQHMFDANKYNNGKSEFIRELDEKAKKWYK